MPPSAASSRRSPDVGSPAGSAAPWRAVVAGGGFGGLYAAGYLARSFDLRPDDEVLLVDARNYFTFTPLLAEVAAGTLGRKHVAVPYRRLAREYGFGFRQAEVRGLDPEAGRLATTAGEIPYDQLILALGSRPRYFGNDRLREVSFPLNTLPDALRLRDRVIGLCELAEAEATASKRQEMLTFVVAGGGPAGVEIASEFNHLLDKVLPAYYPRAAEGEVVLVEGGDRILRGFDAGLAEAGRRTLESRGLDVRMGTLVEEADERTVRLSTDETIPSRTLIWTAGVAPRPLAEEAGLRVERGAAVVDRHLRAAGRENLYVVGDMSAAENPRTGDRFPAVAPIAISQGIRAAGNVENARAGRPPEPYRAHYAGKIVTLGAGDALVEVLGLRVAGLPAWLLYRLVYLFKLVGMQNKARVATTLALNYIFERDLTSGWEAGE